MQRSLRALMIGLLLVIAACGGADFNATPSTTAPAKVTPTTTARALVATTVERPYVDAMVASAAASDGTSSLSSTTYTCVATAIVRGYGIGVFKANGITPNGLRNPDSTLDALPDPTDAQFASIGAELQPCRTGSLLAKSFATGLKLTDPAAIACFAKHVNTDPALRRFVVTSWLARRMDLAGAHDLVGLLSTCIDLPSLILRSSNARIDAATRACMVDALRNSEGELKDYFALLISGSDPTTLQQDYEAILVSLNQCKPSGHTGFTVPSA